MYVITSFLCAGHVRQLGDESSLWTLGYANH